MKISWSHGAHVACFGKIFNDGWAQSFGQSGRRNLGFGRW